MRRTQRVAIESRPRVVSVLLARADAARAWAHLTVSAAAGHQTLGK
jgi:hypothetical protein